MGQPSSAPRRRTIHGQRREAAAETLRQAARDHVEHLELDQFVERGLTRVDSFIDVTQVNKESIMSLLQNSQVGRADVAWLALDELPAPPPRSHRSNQSYTKNEGMTPPTLPGRTVLLAGLLALASVPVLAEVDVLSMSSDARFTSVLKAPPPWSSAYSVTNAAEWIALGRHAQTATPAGQPVGSPFSVDNVQA